MSYITAFGTATPKNKLNQSTIANFMARAMELNPFDTRKIKTIFKASGIEYRHSVLEDYGKENNFTFYPNGANDPFPSTKKRLEVFQQEALPLSKDAVYNLLETTKAVSLENVTHLIIVCCTGMYAPGLDIELVNALKLPSTVQRTCITFMGCYAAFNGLKVADAFCKADQNAKVLLVCTELCSLHFQKTSSIDNLLSNALFADGSAAVLIEAKPTVTKKLKLEAFHNDLAPEGANDMAWFIGDTGFEMKLSTYVPAFINSGIKSLAQSLLEKLTISLNDIQHFAIHPGGRKILETIETALSISKEKNQHAYDVLKNYGNMSSPTVLFVLKALFEKLTEEDDRENILSFAFGPGLTLESMLLKIETVNDARF